MKIAVTYEDGNVFQHFGHTENFKVYQVEQGNVQSADVLPTGENGHGALAGFLRAADVEVLICGGIGEGAKQALKEAGIELYGGVAGSADQAVKDFLENKLTHNPDVACAHHGGQHHGSGHSCGGHCHEHTH